MNASNTITQYKKLSFVAIALCTALFIGCAKTVPSPHHNLVHASTLPDLSGLAWVQDDLFIGVHDAKRNPEKSNWPRVSLVRLPKSEIEGVIWQTLDLKFPGPDISSDLESASPIPGGKGFLFAESGQEGEHARRIFFAVYNNGLLTIESETAWPVPIENVEGMEVCQVGLQLVFLYAERAEDLPATKLRWANLSLNPLAFGPFKEVTVEAVDPVGKGARPISALAVDTEGLIYTVSACDSGTDDGPYRSVVWRIGKMMADEQGNPQVKLDEGKRLATMDGLKVESIAVRVSDKGVKQVYVGTDDEHFGGIIRLLPEVP
ncbi:MAG: hypothetical protein WC799_06520 [Desulfobacteraceae bacterium]|jgi:hypothetical protein